MALGISYSSWQLTEEPPTQHGVVCHCQQGYQNVLDASIRPDSSYTVGMQAHYKPF